jgi:hypothetical protein
VLLCSTAPRPPPPLGFPSRTPGPTATVTAPGIHLRLSPPPPLPHTPRATFWESRLTNLGHAAEWARKRPKGRGNPAGAWREAEGAGTNALGGVANVTTFLRMLGAARPSVTTQCQASCYI